MVSPMEPQWLRETVDEELAGLFSEQRDTVAMTVSRLVERLPYDEALEATLIETLETALELANDDTEGSVWIALILGEVASRAAAPVLVRALSQDDDEDLQSAAGIALLRSGVPGIEALIDALEEPSPGAALVRAGHETLSYAGYIRSEEARALVERFASETLERLDPGDDPLATLAPGVDIDIGDVTDTDTDAEEDEADAATSRRSPAARPAGPLPSRETLDRLEGASRCAAWLGLTSLAPVLARILATLPNDAALAARDYLEMLDEGEGVAVTGDLIPGEESYHWAFEYRGEAFQAQRPGDVDPVGSLEVEGGKRVDLFRGSERGDDIGEGENDEAP